MSRALESALDALHAMAADVLADELQRAITRAEANPDDPGFAVNPQLIDKVLKFLTQNGVNAPVSAPRVDALAAQLADLDLDDHALKHRAH